MVKPSIDVERIVREVLAELGRASQGDAPASRPPSQPSTALEQPEPAGDTDRGDLVLSCRVVTTSEVEGRLEGIRRLVVPQGAVVTPSVHDELYRKNVTLARCGATAQQAADGVRLAVVTAGRCFDPSGLVGALGKEGINLQQHTLDCLVAATDRLAEEVVQGDTLGLLLTRHAAAGLCLANRHRHVRAVPAGDVRRLAAEVASVGANALVVDPIAGSLPRLRQIVTEFCHGGVQPCPEVYRERLA